MAQAFSPDQKKTQPFHTPSSPPPFSQIPLLIPPQPRPATPRNAASSRPPISPAYRPEWSGARNNYLPKTVPSSPSPAPCPPWPRRPPPRPSAVPGFAPLARHHHPLRRSASGCLVGNGQSAASERAGLMIVGWSCSERRRRQQRGLGHGLMMGKEERRWHGGLILHAYPWRAGSGARATCWYR